MGTRFQLLVNGLDSLLGDLLCIPNAANQVSSDSRGREAHAATNLLKLWHSFLVKIQFRDARGPQLHLPSWRLPLDGVR